ncbi:MAG: hypothetical protein QOD61_1597, partial [Solirubrobacteraceae bacterium]|nr:hypothetical protein [Solirubrobacteraceae bacterium]
DAVRTRDVLIRGGTVTTVDWRTGVGVDSPDGPVDAAS